MVRSKKFKFLSPVHEQSSAMMNDAVSRITNTPAVSLATSGPGATNLITGIACAWFDSIPSIFITGQVNSFEMKKPNEGVRQVGFQETNILHLTNSITKFSHQLKSPNEIKEILPKAYFMSMNGRGGPVLIDIPLNFQRAEISNKCKYYYKKKVKKKFYISKEKINIFLKELKTSKKPILLLGHGCRLSGSISEINKLVNKLNIPVVSSWGGKDVYNNFSKNFYGTVGVYGNRHSNLILQNSDLIINLGSRMDTRVTSGAYEKFGASSKIISVDIDKNRNFQDKRPKELLKINTDIKFFFRIYFKKINFRLKISNWKVACNYLINKLEEIKQPSKLTDPKLLFQKLSLYNKKINYIFADTGAI